VRPQPLQTNPYPNLPTDHALGTNRVHTQVGPIPCYNSFAGSCRDLFLAAFRRVSSALCTSAITSCLPYRHHRFQIWPVYGTLSLPPDRQIRSVGPEYDEPCQASTQNWSYTHEIRNNFTGTMPIDLAGT